MRPALWRILALSLIAVAIAFVCYQVALPDRDDFGIHFIVPPGAPGSIQVTSVEANSPAARAGIRKGDRLTYGATELERARVNYPIPGSPVTVTVNGTHPVTLTARHIQRLFSWIPLAIRLAFLSVAALLAWRRPDDPATRALVVFLFSYGLVIGLNNGVLPSPVLSLIVLTLLNTVLLLAGTGAAAAFAARFPSGQAKPVPRLLSNIAQIVTVIGMVIAIAGVFLSRSPATISFLTTSVLTTFIVAALLVAATLIVAYVQGEEDERQRRRWVFLLLGSTLAVALVAVLTWNVFGYNPIIDDVTLLWIGLTPFGLAYVILRHRVIDVGFVLNRAVVYTSVSLIVVAIFVIVETLLSKYVEQTSHIGSIAARLAVALVLGFSVRAIHSRVDRFVDAVLFRERHLAEAAIRTFTHDAAYITDASVLLSRCIKTVQKYTHARGTGVWTAQSSTYRAAVATFEETPNVDENDPAVVAMRARRVIVELRDTESALPGALAFPMIVRGELLGILVCGQKIDDETYDPEERELLAALASSVGHTLDAIEIRELRRRLEALTGGAAG